MLELGRRWSALEGLREVGLRCRIAGWHCQLLKDGPLLGAWGRQAGLYGAAAKPGPAVGRRNKASGRWDPKLEATSDDTRAHGSNSAVV
jgi:hypothetical protein